MGTFIEEVALIIENENLKHLHPGESEKFKEEFTKLLRKLNSARTALTMDFCKVDSRGRVTLPLNYRVLLGIEKSTEMEIHLFPDGNKPKGLLLRKSPY